MPVDLDRSSHKCPSHRFSFVSLFCDLFILNMRLCCRIKTTTLPGTCGTNGLRRLRIRRGKTRSVGCSAILALLAATLFTVANGYPEGKSSSSSATQSSLKNSIHKNLPNFGEATVTLYHGGQPSKSGFRTLAKMGVNIVVDPRGRGVASARS